MPRAIDFRHIVPSVYLPALLTAISHNTTLVLLPLYVLYLGHDASIAAMMFAIRALGTVTGSVPGGKLIERFGDKRTMLIGVALSSLTYLGIGLTTSIPAIALFSFFGGFSSACSLLGRQSYLAGRFASNQRGRIIGLLGGVFRGGSLIGPAAGGFLTLAFGYSTVFVILSLLCLTAFFLVLKFVDPSEGHERVLRKQDRASIFKILVDYRQIFLTAGIATIGLQFMRSVRSLLVPLVGASIGLEVDTLGLIVSAGAAVDILMVYPTGHIMDRFGRKTSAVPAFFIFAVALFLMSGVETAGGLLAIVILMGFANGMTAGLILVMGADYAPENNRGPFLGVWRLVSDVGNISSPTAIGLLLKVMSITTTGAIAGLIGLAATGVFTWAVKEPLIKRDADKPKGAAGSEVSPVETPNANQE